MNIADQKAKVLTSFTQYKRINHHITFFCHVYTSQLIDVVLLIDVVIFFVAPMITHKHRTYVPRPTDGGGNPVGVIYTADNNF